ncbi:MAG TPA: DUF3106 domain-containing protein [Candidatus Acidoferrum sp.]|jgi:hypothetical protein|nr:DUF3106 domain-containing protein [Candidatus Acidoferrum sp.]
MNREHLKPVWALMMIGACLLSASLAQQDSSRLLSPASNAVARLASVPMPPPAKCPVEFFRELLAKPLAERVQLLTNRSVVSQKLILAKLHEYEALGAEERELRLRATELRWYLLPLMSAPVSERPAQLALIPAELRQLVADRLQVWDNVPSDAQKRLLLPAVNYLSMLQADPATRRAEVQSRIPPARQVKLEADIRDWQNRSEAERQDIANHFKDFFELTPQERAKTLATLSEPERRQIEKTFDKFWELSPPQRALCVRAFKKFATLSLAERQRFLENTQLWEQMAPSERQTWKDLVYSFGNQPPLPPGLNSPPLPPRSPPRLPPTPVMATNRN